MTHADHPVVGKLLSVNVGLPRDVAWQGKTIRTAVWKEPVEGPGMARKINVDGDAQGDLAAHGGEHRAVFVYQIDSYRYWERELGRNDFVHGQFGENFTVDGLADEEVCIGDRFQIGEATFEVTQPRVTCYRVGIRMNDPRIPAMLVSHRRPEPFGPAPRCWPRQRGSGMSTGTSPAYTRYWVGWRGCKPRREPEPRPESVGGGGLDDFN